MTTLLLVEDDPAMRDPMRMLLEHAGYRVLVAQDGSAALAAMAGVRPDAVITDWSMPVMDGVALCRRMRRDTRLAAIPVVLMSASSPPSGPASWDVFLPKPLSVDQVERALQTLLGASKGCPGGQPRGTDG